MYTLRPASSAIKMSMLVTSASHINGDTDTHCARSTEMERSGV
jgi:hypothetical protein